MNFKVNKEESVRNQEVIIDELKESLTKEKAKYKKTVTIAIAGLGTILILGNGLKAMSTNNRDNQNINDIDQSVAFSVSDIYDEQPELSVVEEPVEASTLDFEIIGRKIMSAYIPQGETLIGTDYGSILDFFFGEEPGYVLVESENDEYNVYLCDIEEMKKNTTGFIYDYMTGADIDVRNVKKIEAHQLEQLIASGELRESSKFGTKESFSVSETKTNGQVIEWVMNNNYGLIYNWANYYFSINNIDATVVMPENIPAIKKENIAKSEAEKDLSEPVYTLKP